MKINNEIKIGILIIAVLGILGYFTIHASDFKLNEKGYQMKVLFQSVDGVGLKAPVMLNGFEVGQVDDIKILYGNDETKMELTVFLKEDAKVREGTKAYVKNMGFMGEKYVGLTSGDKGKPYLPPGSVIMGEQPPDFDKLVADGQVIASEFKEISINLNERLNKNKENIDNTLSHLNSITENLDERLKANEQHIDSLIAHLDSAGVNLDQFTYDLKLHPWKLLYRSKETREESIRLLDKSPK